MRRRAIKQAIRELNEITCFMKTEGDDIYPSYSPFEITTGKHLRHLWRVAKRLDIVVYPYMGNPKFVDSRKYHLWAEPKDDGLQFEVGVCLFGKGK